VSAGSVEANAAVAKPTAAEQVSALSGAVSTEVKPKPKTKFKTCKDLNKVFKHGVGKKGAKDKVKGKAQPVKNFTVSTKVFNLNTKLDVDKDGIACEKS
jgi:hypothetical protein